MTNHMKKKSLSKLKALSDIAKLKSQSQSEDYYKLQLATANKRVEDLLKKNVFLEESLEKITLDLLVDQEKTNENWDDLDFNFNEEE